MAAKAYCLIKVKPGKAFHVFESLSKLEYVELVEAVTGPYDIIAYLKAPDFSTLGKFILENIHTLDGIAETLTCNVIEFGK
ncbi:Lrp/AsnC family transcriptional regulator [bacterium]|nr:MAG: Lrp/AsnC family transcriptional regulator [bacterium]RKZ27070.1 MAG: Lrp/AsnC family transcriptional regulator [bacterium]